MRRNCSWRAKLRGMVVDSFLADRNVAFGLVRGSAEPVHGVRDTEFLGIPGLLPKPKSLSSRYLRPYLGTLGQRARESLLMPPPFARVF